MDKKIGFVVITPQPRGAEIFYQFLTFCNPKPNGKVTCYIPAFDIFYSANSREEVNKKGAIVIKLYLDHFFNNTNSNNPMRDFVLQLHHLGFKAMSDAYAMKAIIQGTQKNTVKFNANNKLYVPAEFADGYKVTQESKMAVAS